MIAQRESSPRIIILLSTFNGERFLCEQLESFLAQDYPHWAIHWRDDGSSDATVAMMRGFAARIGPRRCVESCSSGPHLGAAMSFLTLLAENEGAQAVAFADQDDVWLPTKLRRAAAHIAAAGGPALYCARQILVDEALRGDDLLVAHVAVPGFPASLTQNIANGNTLVMNGAAARLVAAMGRPTGTVHDWWSYIVVSACGGRVLFDLEPCILYRLHKNNLIGAARPLVGRALAALSRGPEIFMTMMCRHARALAAQPDHLSQQASQDLHVILAGLEGGFAARLAALRCSGFARRTGLENILFRYWFLTDSSVPHAQAALPAWAAPDIQAAE